MLGLMDKLMLLLCKRVFLQEPQLLQGYGLELSSNLQTNLHSRRGDVA